MTVAVGGPPPPTPPTPPLGLNSQATHNNGSSPLVLAAPLRDRQVHHNLAYDPNGEQHATPYEQ